MFLLKVLEFLSKVSKNLGLFPLTLPSMPVVSIISIIVSSELIFSHIGSVTFTSSYEKFKKID